jgi:maltooligosyltrehalose trehalohydrolase
VRRGPDHVEASGCHRPVATQLSGMHQHGPTPHGEGVRFRVWAPRADALRVRALGGDHAMHREGEGFFACTVPGAVDGTRYRLVLPDGRALPDPASRRQPDGVHGDSAVLDPRRMRWRHSFRGLPREALVLYELHVGTFTPEGTLDAAARRLPDLADLGVTCVELLPVQPFPGTRNWGYDGVFPHAVHEGYGGPGALQRFVDAAHGLGLAVCLDVVYNHLGPEGNYTGAFGPYFTDRHKSMWGDGLDFDGPGAGPVRAFMVEAALQWVRDFRVDALRLDAVHAIVDDGAQHLVAEIAARVAEVARATGREIHVIAESDLEDRKVVDPPPQGWGCTAMWADDFHHAVHALLTGERRTFLADFGEPEHLARVLRSGFRFQGERSAFRGRPWGTPTRGLAPSRFVFSSQNHDQIGNRPFGDRLSTLVPWEALAPVAALTCLAPGIPLLFQGEEYGETRPFLFFTSHSDPGLAAGVTRGRRAEHIAETGGREVPDPQAEETFAASKLTHARGGPHGALRRLYRELLAVRRRHAHELGTVWPEVEQLGRAFHVAWATLELRVNLGPQPAAGLPGWGWALREGEAVRTPHHHPVAPPA